MPKWPLGTALRDRPSQHTTPNGQEGAMLLGMLEHSHPRAAVISESHRTHWRAMLFGGLLRTVQTHASQEARR